MRPATGDPTEASAVRFGLFVFDTATGELTRQGSRIPLQDQPARVLSLFVRHAGRLVTREEVRQALWPEDTFVEFEAAIAVAINKIRRALGDSAANPRFVETIPKHGYRFLADVHPVTPPPPVDLHAVPNRSSRFRGSPTWMFVVAMVIILAAVSGAVRSRRSALAGGAAPLSLTVMPFQVAGSGLRENVGMEVANAIAKRVGPLGGVHVTPWLQRSTSAGSDAPALGRQLGVDAVLTGTMGTSGNGVHVSIELVRTKDGSTWWQEQFDVARAEISSIENRVAERLAGGLNLPLTGTQRARLARQSTTSIDAYRWYLEGRWFLERRSEQDLRTAVSAFRHATEADPTYALAYAWLANAYGMLTYFGSIPPWEGGAFVTAAADRALQLDDALAEANLVSAGTLGFFKWRWADADGLFLKALALDPNYAEGRHWYAVYLEVVGRLDDALAQRRRANALAPESTLLGAAMGDYFLYARQPQQALEVAEKLLLRNPSFASARSVRGRAYDQLGRFDLAIADLEEAHHARPESGLISASLVSALASAGRDREARAHVAAVITRAREQYVSPYDIGVMYDALGSRDEAFRWFTKACDIKDPRLSTIRASTPSEHFKSDPRFQTLLACVGLPPLQATRE